MPGDTARANGKLGGRPVGSKSKKTLEAEGYRAILMAKVFEKAKPLVEALVQKGLGGDIAALKEIHERVLGKVTDKVDVDIVLKIDV